VTDKEFDLSILGSKVDQPTHPDQATLEVIPNRWVDANYEVNLICEEFTCVCPMTSQPDFAKILINYIPDQLLVESKALKLYLGSYRNLGIFHEFVINKICHDLVTALKPKEIEVKGEFSARGGIRIVPVSRWKAGDEIPQPLSL